MQDVQQEVVAATGSNIKDNHELNDIVRYLTKTLM